MFSDLKEKISKGESIAGDVIIELFKFGFDLFMITIYGSIEYLIKPILNSLKKLIEFVLNIETDHQALSVIGSIINEKKKIKELTIIYDTQNTRNQFEKLWIFK